MEDEWGPGQCEFTFDPAMGLVSADNMLLFRTAAKQQCRRNGYHATFMTRPALPNFFSSDKTCTSRCAKATAAMRSPTTPTTASR